MRLLLELILVLSGLALTACSSGHHKPGATSDSAAPKKAYQATYRVPRGNLFAEERIYADGRGHYRMEVDSTEELLPGTIVTLLDMNTHQTTLWTEGRNAKKAYATGPSPFIDPLRMMVAPESYPKSNDMVSLGNKVIDGHRCHGWKNSSGSESWIDDDYGCVVYGKAGSAGESMKITSWSTSTPDAALFKPPPDYIKAPGAGTAQHR